MNNKVNKILIDKSLPHNFLAEKLILSCIIFNSETLEITKESLIIEAFYFKNHQELYKALLKMKKKGLSIDLITLAIFLQDNGLLTKIGGIKVLLDLGIQSPIFSSLNEYIRIVKEKFLKRYLIKLGYKIINLGYLTNNSLENIVTELEQELLYLITEINIKKTVTTAQVLNDLFSELKNKFLNPHCSGLPSGFSKLDLLTQGFQKSDLIIIAGRPSMGKTAISLNIAVNCIKFSRLPILFYSLEMSREQILYRLLSSETGINQMRLKNGQLTNNDWIKLTKIIRLCSKLPFIIDDRPNLSIQEIRSRIKTILLEQKQLGLVIIDYLQLIKGLTTSQNNRVQELSKITQSLKNLAKEFNIPIIALSQLSRSVENRIDQRPVLADLRESGSIEQDADLVLLLSRINSNFQLNDKTQDQLNKIIITELIIAKHRNGPIGRIELQFHKSNIKFVE